MLKSFQPQTEQNIIITALMALQINRTQLIVNINSIIQHRPIIYSFFLQ